MTHVVYLHTFIRVFQLRYDHTTVRS